MPSGASSKRNAAKKAAQKNAEEESVSEKPGAPSTTDTSFDAQVIAIAKSSVLFQAALKMPELFKDIKQIAKEKKEQKADDDLDNVPDFADTAAGETSEAMKEMLHLATAVDSAPAGKEAPKKATATNGDAASLFAAMATRLSVTNPLGLFESGGNCIKAFKVISELEFDGGKGTKRKGPFDRISTNARSHCLAYLHAVWVLMNVRAFLFRSFFACLPWLFGWQLASTMLPLAKTNEVPIPLEKVPVEARAAITLGMHGLMWLFFVYEFLFQLWWLEWMLLAVLIGGHAYSFRPLNS